MAVGDDFNQTHFIVSVTYDASKGAYVVLADFAFPAGQETGSSRVMANMLAAARGAVNETELKLLDDIEDDEVRLEVIKYISDLQQSGVMSKEIGAQMAVVVNVGKRRDH